MAKLIALLLFALILEALGVVFLSQGLRQIGEIQQLSFGEVARIIGADPGTVVMHQNVSICQSLVLSCFEPTPKRNKIVYSELNFPSVMYVYEAHARNGNLRIETVKSDDGITVPLERMLAAIDEETLLVPFSHVLFKSAFLQDAKAITERAHEVGAMVVLALALLRLG